MASARYIKSNHFR